MEFRPFRIALTMPFRGVHHRTGVLIHGAAWGEYSPFADYSAERASRWWAAAMEAARGQWPTPVREAVPVNSIVPDVSPELAAVLAVAGGCRTAKVKVGGRDTLAADEARIEAVAAALGPSGRVRIDVNGAWDVDQAVRAVRALDAAARRGGVSGIEYVEQPCASVAELAMVRRRVSVPIAADESVRIPGNADAVVAASAADLIVLKAAPLGGVRRSLLVAERAGLPCVVSSAMETSVGLSAELALALALPDLPYACGLGTGALLAGDTVEQTLLPSNGMMRQRPLEVIV